MAGTTWRKATRLAQTLLADHADRAQERCADGQKEGVEVLTSILKSLGDFQDEAVQVEDHGLIRRVGAGQGLPSARGHGRQRGGWRKHSSSRMAVGGKLAGQRCCWLPAPATVGLPSAFASSSSTRWNRSLPALPPTRIRQQHLRCGSSPTRRPAKPSGQQNSCRQSSLDAPAIRVTRTAKRSRNARTRFSSESRATTNTFAFYSAGAHCRTPAAGPRTRTCRTVLRSASSPGHASQGPRFRLSVERIEMKMRRWPRCERH